MEKTKKQLNLEILVDELMKDLPNKNKIRELSFQLGIPYSTNQISMMSTVLQSANSVYLKNTSKKQSRDKDATSI